MVTATFSELRNNAKRFFDLVEQGEAIEIYRHGKPVAILSPIRHQAMDRWKIARPLELDGVSVSKAILAERESER